MLVGILNPVRRRVAARIRSYHLKRALIGLQGELFGWSFSLVAGVLSDLGADYKTHFCLCAFDKWEIENPIFGEQLDLSL